MRRCWNHVHEGRRWEKSFPEPPKQRQQEREEWEGIGSIWYMNCISPNLTKLVLWRETDHQRTGRWNCDESLKLIKLAQKIMRGSNVDSSRERKTALRRSSWEFLKKSYLLANKRLRFFSVASLVMCCLLNWISGILIGNAGWNCITVLYILLQSSLNIHDMIVMF